MDTQDKTEKSDNKATPSKLEWLQKRLAEWRVVEEEVSKKGRSWAMLFIHLLLQFSGSR
jgi:hypothetical protein